MEKPDNKILSSLSDEVFARLEVHFDIMPLQAGRYISSEYGHTHIFFLTIMQPGKLAGYCCNCYEEQSKITSIYAEKLRAIL